MNPYHERNIKPPKFMKLVNFVEVYGNSLALYLLLLLLAVSIWIASPIPSPNLTANGTVLAWVSVILVCITALHGLLWFIITRESFHLQSRSKQFLSTSIKMVKPLHMMTGMVGLGLASIHGFAFFSLAAFSNALTISGIVALFTLIILTIDGIGLMVTPFLSRKVHRWIALTFIVSLVVHLVLIFT